MNTSTKAGPATPDNPTFASQVEERLSDLRRYARRLTGNAADAEDLVQDCLLRALTNWHRFEPGTNLRAWLFTVMRNLHLNSFRRPSRHEMSMPIDELAEAGPVRPPAQEAAVEMKDFLRAFGQLTSARQKTITLVGWDGMSYEEAATVLGVPTGTVRSRLSRAREELRDRLAGSHAPHRRVVANGDIEVRAVGQSRSHL